jgi:beta-mannosidase
VIDSALRPKAAYYAARRFFAPVLVSFAPADDGIEVWGTNDFLMDVQGRLTLTLCTFRGKVLANKKMRVRLPANASERLFVIPRSWMQERGEYVRADLADGRRAVSVNRHFLREPKHSDFPKARIHIDLQKIARGSHRAVLKSNVLALGAALASTKEGVFFHDNFIDLDPGVPHEILITSDLSPAALRKSLSVFALNSSNGNSRGTS